jgi:seryl-tRNA synthetase
MEGVNEMSTIELAKEFIELDAAVKDMDAELKELKAKRDELNTQLADAMLADEMQSINVQGRLLYVFVQKQASYKKEIEDRFFEELRGHGLGAIIKPNVNHNTLNATVRELITANNDEVPDWITGLVDIYEVTKIGIRKS